MTAVEVYIFDMCPIVGRNREASFIGAEYINIVHMNIHDIICRFRPDLEKIAIRITDNIPHFIMCSRAGKAE
jgi:hypothetical protein